VNPGESPVPVSLLAGRIKSALTAARRIRPAFSAAESAGHMMANALSGVLASPPGGSALAFLDRWHQTAAARSFRLQDAC
jgi:hypothetical protein